MPLPRCTRRRASGSRCQIARRGRARWVRRASAWRPWYACVRRWGVDGWGVLLYQTIGAPTPFNFFCARTSCGLLHARAVHKKKRQKEGARVRVLLLGDLTISRRPPRSTVCHQPSNLFQLRVPFIQIFFIVESARHLVCVRAEGRAGAHASLFQIFLRSETEGKYLDARI